MTMLRIAIPVFVGAMMASVANAQSRATADDRGAGLASGTRPDAGAHAPFPSPVGVVHRSATSPPGAYQPFQAAQVSVAESGSRRRRAAIGAAVGAVAGLVVFAIDMHQCRPENEIPCGLGAETEFAIFVGGGALAGALVGAVLPGAR